MVRSTIQGVVVLTVRPFAAAADGLGQMSLGLAERAVDRAMSGRLVDIVARDLVRYDVLERLAGQLAPELERIVEKALETPGVERMLTQIVESRAVRDAVARVADDAVERLRTSDAMWTLIDDIAQSPVVTEAIAQQGYGFADQVGEQVRERSRHADARLERVAQRLLRRRPQAGGPEPAPSGAT
jgi:hypothetical protein